MANRRNRTRRNRHQHNYAFDITEDECRMQDCLWALLASQIFLILIVVLAFTTSSPKVVHKRGKSVDMRLVPYLNCSSNTTLEGSLKLEKLESVLFAKVWYFKNYSITYVGEEGLRGNLVKIAIGVAVTSKTLKWNEDFHKTLVFFKYLLPSFCKTASQGYHYHFFLAYDKDDKLFNHPNCSSKIHWEFHNFTKHNCPKHSDYSIYFVQCLHKNTPAWAQNDAMMEAYFMDMEYFYRINDDTKMVTLNWTNIYIQTLRSFHPPNVGVVGPMHKGGNMEILTYDFVHKTHIDIHGYYYPHMYKDWYADNWITDACPKNNTLKLESVKLEHTLDHGTRYRVDRIVAIKVAKGMKLPSYCSRYIKQMEQNRNMQPKPDHVISMGLSKNSLRHIYGAVRNAQLRPVYFPDWTLRIYVLNNTVKLPSRVLSKLKQLQAQVVYITEDGTVPSTLVKYTVLQDPLVNFFLIRDPDERLSLRDSQLTRHWISNASLSSSPVFCGADQIKPNSTIISKFLGAKKNRYLNKVFQDAITRVKQEFNSTQSKLTEQEFLTNLIWPRLANVTQCFYSNAIKEKTRQKTPMRSVPFPSSLDFLQGIRVGTLFNEFDEVVEK